MFPKIFLFLFLKNLCFNKNSQSIPAIQILFGPAVKSNIRSWHQFVAMEIIEMSMFLHYGCTHRSRWAEKEKIFANIFLIINQSISIILNLCYYKNLSKINLNSAEYNQFQLLNFHGKKYFQWYKQKGLLHSFIHLIMFSSLLHYIFVRAA